MAKPSRNLNSNSRAKIKHNRNMTCELCGRKRKKENLLEVHHIDGNIKNNSYNNLLVVCGVKTKQNCHKKLEESLTPKLLRIFPKMLASGEREKNPPALTRSDFVKRQVDYSKGSAEMQGNEYFEMPYYKWLIRKILNSESKAIPKDEAINSGAWSVGCNSSTSRKYLDIISSEEGPLMIYKDPDFKRKMVRIMNGRLEEAKKIAGLD